MCFEGKFFFPAGARKSQTLPHICTFGGTNHHIMFNYGIDKLDTGKALAILRGELKATLSEEARQKIEASHKIVLDTAKGNQAVYGINTGFGPLCDTIISKENTSELQRKLLLSHAVGVGDGVMNNC